MWNDYDKVSAFRATDSPQATLICQKHFLWFYQFLQIFDYIYNIYIYYIKYVYI